MPRDITVTFEDGATHVYRGAPDDVTPEVVAKRAQSEFGKAVTALDGGRKAAGLAAVDSGGRGEMVAEGLRPSNLAGAGRSASVGGLMPGEIPAEGLDPARRGTMRAARPFVAGDERVVAPPEAFRPPPFRTRDAGVSVLDQPAPTQHERLLDRRQQEARPFDPYDTAGNIAASRNPDQAVAADAQARDAARRAAEQSAAEQEARAKIAKTPGWLGDSSAGTAAAAVAQWAPNLVHMVGSLWNVAGAGAFDNTLRVLEKSADSLDEAKSREMRRDAAKLRAMLADPNATGADVAVFIATHPGKLADEIAAAVPSMLLAAGGGGALGALGTRAVSGAALKAGMNPAALQAEMAALRTKMAGLGAGASNVAINAGDTFSDPRLARESILDRLNAAAIAGAGTVLAGRATAGGAERAIATGARPGALRLGTRESGQEIIENTAQSAGVAAGSEAEAFDPNSAAKEAVLAGAAGFGAGAGPAALASRRADPYTQAAATGFIVDPPLATDQPQVQRKKTEAILDNVAAMYGIPPRVVQMLRAGAEGKPLAELGPAYVRGIQWLQERGLVPEVAPEVLEALGHGSAAPPAEQNAEQPAAAPVAASQAPGRSADGEGGAAPTRAGGGPQQAVSSIEATLRGAGALPPPPRGTENFAPESGTLGIPRDQMPQVAAEHRGALVNFLAARGVSHEAGEADPSTLKPTQATFSPRSVEDMAAQPAQGGRSVLVSSDGHILDGHHQALAAAARGEPVKVIRLGAPIQDLLRLAHQFPSSTSTTRRAAPPAGATSRVRADAPEVGRDAFPTDAEFFGDGVKARAIRAQGFGSLDVDDQSVVQRGVLAALHDRQVLRAVVESVPVDVVHVLVGKKLATKDLLGDPAVLLDRLAAPLDDPVRAAAVARFVDAVAAGHPDALARFAAEKEAALGVGKAVGADGEGRAARGARDVGSHSAIVPPRLQNRNRSDAAYVQQMQSIAANPDPGRLGFSRDFASGAPVVLDAGGTPGAAYGRTDYVTSSRGRRIPVRYAVVEASSLLPSNTADGGKVAGYEEGAPGRARVVAGNGRAAGLVAGYGMGKADAYRSGLAEDAALHGIDAETLARFKQPVLVREMRNEDVTTDIGDESNVSGIAERSAPEVARDDARRIDLAALEFDEDGGLTDAAVRRFIDSQPVSEQTALRDSRGHPTRQAIDRLTSAIFAAAYENDALLALQAQATDPEARTVLSGLVAAAPAMVQLKGSTHDIRALVAEAAVAAVNARRRGIKMADMAAQADLDADPEIRPVLDMFAKNIRSAKKIGDNLRTAATRASLEANRPAEDMFGEVPKRTRQQVLSESFDDATSAQDLGEQAGAEPDARLSGRPRVDADRAGGVERTAGSGAEQGDLATTEDPAQALTAKAERPARTSRAQVIELRKRLSVLESLRACLTS